MPRRKRSKTDVTFTPDQAKLLLEQLIAARQISSRDLDEARRALDAEVLVVQARLSALKGAPGAPSPSPSRQPGKAAPKAAAVSKSSRGRKKQVRPPITPERKKIMQLQGRFLGFMHKIPKAEMVKFRAMIATKGKEATVEAMEKYVNSHASKGTGKTPSRRKAKRRA